MMCPFCKQPISDNVVPLEHMMRCQNEERILWERRFQMFITAQKERTSGTAQEI